MADSLALVVQNGQLERVGVTDAADTLLVRPGAGATGGIDVDSAGNMSIGVTNANALTIGSTGVVSTVAGSLLVTEDTQIGAGITDTLEVIASIENNSVFGFNVSLLFLNTQNHAIVVNTASGSAGGTMALAAGGGDSEFAGGLVNVSGGFGGDSAGAAVGGTGGNAEISGGDGGAGDATFAAGAGGIGRVEGGDGGTPGAAGGGVGGNAEIMGGAGSGAAADGQIVIGQVNTSSITIGTSSVPTTIYAADVATPTTGRDLNDTSVGTAGSFAVGCYDDPAWVNIAPATSDLQGMLDAIDVAVGAGATLQSAYAANPTITEDNTDQAVTIARGTNASTAVLILNDNTSAVVGNVLEIDRSPTSGPTAGDAIEITIGANANARALYVVDGGTGTTLAMDKTGASGNIVSLSSGGTEVFQISRVGRIIAGGYASIALQPLTSITAGVGGYSADFEGGDGFAAGGGSDATQGGAAVVQPGAGGASDGTNASAAGGQLTLRGGASGAGSGAIAGTVGATARMEGGAGGAQGSTGDPGGGGSVIIVGGAAGAGGAGNAANGGTVTITGGAAASNATGTFGGNVAIAGGAEGSGGTGNGGSVTLNGGAGTTNPGDITLGTTRVRRIDSGNATNDPTWTHTGSFAVTTAAQKNALVNLTQPTQARATAGDFAEAIECISTGTDAASFSVLYGVDNPNNATAVDAGDVGSLFVDTVTPALWQKTAASTWTQFAAAPSLSDVIISAGAPNNSVDVSTVIAANPIILSDGASTSGNAVLTVTRTGITSSGNGIQVNMGVGGEACTGEGIKITTGGNYLGNALDMDHAGGGNAVLVRVDSSGVFTITGGGTVNITPRSGQYLLQTVSGGGNAQLVSATALNPLLELQPTTQARTTAAYFAEVIQITCSGTNAEAASILLGADNPNNATAVNEGETGSVFLDAATPELWQKVAASTWERIGVTGDGLISLTGGSTAQTGVTSTPSQVTGFTANGADPDLTTPDHTSDDITLDAPGVWRAVWTCSFTGTTNSVFTGKITCTGSGTVNGGTWQSEVLATSRVRQVSAEAFITGAAAADTVECTIQVVTGSKSFTPIEMTLLVERVRRS